jgi:hypothetical protein
MKTLTKAKTSAARTGARRGCAVSQIKGLSPRRLPPTAVGTVADVIKLGTKFAKDADWDVIEAAHAARDL